MTSRNLFQAAMVLAALVFFAAPRSIEGGCCVHQASWIGVMYYHHADACCPAPTGFCYAYDVSTVVVGVYRNDLPLSSKNATAAPWAGHFSDLNKYVDALTDQCPPISGNFIKGNPLGGTLHTWYGVQVQYRVAPLTPIYCPA